MPLLSSLPLIDKWLLLFILSIMLHYKSLNFCSKLKRKPMYPNFLISTQVFPLLIEKFSFEEQADLVWQFLCSIPVTMMVEFLPWLSSCISPDERQDMIECLCKIVPEEKLLQQVNFCPRSYLFCYEDFSFYLSNNNLIDT